MGIPDLIKSDVLYKTNGNIYHFILEEKDRPVTPKYLSKELYDLFPDTYNFVLEKQKIKLSRIQKNEHFEKSYIDYVETKDGVIVDIATGPNGGWTHGILKNLSKNVTLISTDACNYCIDSYTEFYNQENYYYFDLDLDKPLPFKDNAIDIFTGSLLCNVSNYKNLLTEISRCLKTGGKAVFEEIFYSDNSVTYEYLIKENAIFASSDIYSDFCKKIGLEIVKIDVCEKMVGKMDPGDGLPLSDSDESYTKNIYLYKK